jgi:RNA polymerase sigma-70 factor, ECF subfamily
MGLPDRRRALEQMVEDHYVPLYRYAYRLTGCANAADDLTQETFCKAQASFEQLRDATRAKAWLFRILRNAYLQSRREEQRHRSVSLDGVLEPQARIPDPLPELDPAQLQAALDDLPEDFRTPIILYYFSEFSYREIAEQMDLPLGTVMSRLARAKAHLRDRLVTRDPLTRRASDDSFSREPQASAEIHPPRRTSDGL